MVVPLASCMAAVGVCSFQVRLFKGVGARLGAVHGKQNLEGKWGSPGGLAGLEQPPKKKKIIRPSGP